MTWRMSRFRRGDLVEVRGREEILATLDAEGCLDGMPFMPEMLQYCGRRFRVGMVAHKTCEVAHRTFEMRRLGTTVHLKNLRCDGSSHGGCEAACNLYWKDAWLKVADERDPSTESRPLVCGDEVDASALQAHTIVQHDREDQGVRYSCQATRLFAATRSISWWNPWQYLRDVTSGNHSARRVASVLFLSLLKYALDRAPRGYRAIQFVRKQAHRSLLGSETPDIEGAVSPGARTPVGRLDLNPGELVRVKSREEISRTLDVKRRNRGMYFDAEMTPYCGRVGRVRNRVTKLIHEETGEMIQMKQPSVIVEKFVCRGMYSECRLLCPRAIYPYWREIWLEQVREPSEPEPQS